MLNFELVGLRPMLTFLMLNWQVAFALAVTQHSTFNNAAESRFSPPVDYDISLAGNFGEPRPNHFHGGIDVKTGGVEGKHIYSIGDGYVSRVTVGLLGFGNAVYVTHPEGQTSVYCHLKSFSPRIKALLRKWQYAHQSWCADMRLKPMDCPVAKGQFIAISGNTGASTAPHLHLEIHDTRTWNMLDPLDYLSAYVEDGLAPMAHGFMAYPQIGEGVFCGGQSKQTYGFPSHNLARHFTAWGKVGFGVWANDYMEITYNRYGVRQTILRVDGKEVFRSDVNNIPVQSNRMVNSWGDYEHFMRYRIWYMKSFVEPGNTLSILYTDANRGIVDFNEERDYHLEYELQDFKGNKSIYTFVVRGVKTAIRPAPPRDYRLTMKWNETNTYSVPGMQLVIPYGMLATDVVLRPSTTHRGDLSPCYSFSNRSMPLFSWAELSIAVRRKVVDPSKLYIVSHSGGDRFQGGTYKDGWVTGRLRELGAGYELAYDDQPPTVIPIGEGSWSSRHEIRFGVSDSKSGLKYVKGYLDGQFILFEDMERSTTKRCKLEETPIKKTGQMRTLKFVAIDNRNNVKTYTAQVKY